MKKLFNRIITVLIFTDVILMIGLGFIAPVFAIFITNNIIGGTIEVAGYAAAIYWIVKSLVTIPFGHFLDKNHGEKDDLIFVAGGSFLAVISTLGYIFARLPWHIYALEAIFAVGMGMNIPGFTAIFTRHIDEGREAFDWSVHSSAIGFGAGLAGALGGVVAYRFGFTALFIGVSVIILISAILPLILLKNVSSKNVKVLRTIPATDLRPPMPK